MNNLFFLPRQLVVTIIRIYQRFLSFDHGPLKALYPYGFCRFTPTCSTYAIEVITKYGIIKGVPQVCWRILRCNPWNHGGHDPVK